MDSSNHVHVAIGSSKFSTVGLRRPLRRGEYRQQFTCLLHQILNLFRWKDATLCNQFKPKKRFVGLFHDKPDLGYEFRP